MLHRLTLRDFVIVDALEVELASGFGVLTGETGAGKSILVDALQLALGGRGDAGVVREGATRADIAAEFDTPRSLAGWLADGGFDAAGGEDDAGARLLLRRAIDAQGKSRAWINGAPATVTQLREAAEHLVDIHGQHAWQGLTRAASVRALVDGHAGLDARPLGTAFRAWRQTVDALADARARQGGLERERERLAWQIGELETLAPGPDEWSELDAEHTRLAQAQSLIDAAQGALDAIDADDGGATNAARLVAQAASALDAVHGYDAALGAPLAALRDAEAQLADAARTLASYLNRTDLDPARLRVVDERLSAWLSLARRHRVPPAELAALLAGWQREAASLEAASDLDGLARAVDAARVAFDREAALATAARRKAAPALGRAVTEAMQKLGMAGGRFAVELVPSDEPQAHGRESPELLVAGHAGATPRPLGRVASGGELSRIALAIAVVTSTSRVERESLDDGSAPTLVFDEVDAGIGGAVAETVGRLLEQLGRRRQVLAVTHLPQVAASADHHHVVAKRMVGGRAASTIRPVTGEERVAEIARMLGGEKLSSTSLAHAEEMLDTGRGADPVAATGAAKPAAQDPPAADARKGRRAPKGAR